MYDIDEARRINKYLQSLEHDFQGNPIFRLVWADDEFEYRHGTYNEFYKNLFVRTVTGVKKTPKYPMFAGKWVLEQLFDKEKLQAEEIKEHNGYECFYTFQDKYFNPLPLRLRVVELIMKAKFLSRKSEMLSKSLLQAEMDKKDKESYQHIFDAIDPSTPMQSSLHFKEGVSYHGLTMPDITTKTGEKKNA